MEGNKENKEGDADYELSLIHIFGDLESATTIL